MAHTTIDPSDRRALLRQRAISRALSPMWVPAFTGVMRVGLGWSVEDHDTLRNEYARIRAQSDSPMIICANHLTMVDSFVIAWALGSASYYLRHFDAIGWNTPETKNFASTWWKRALAYILKCVPIERGSDRQEVARVLERVEFLMALGEPAMIFPEGGRSRSGRVELETAAYGVGRLVRSQPGCRVVCLYLRGESQESWSESPRRGERFRWKMQAFEPKSDARGLRGSLDISRQIVGRLVEMEEAWFDDRK